MGSVVNEQTVTDSVAWSLAKKMSPSEKAARIVDLTRTACTLALAGLRARYPGADERELLQRLTALRLGAEATSRAYGWRAPDGA